MYLHIDIQINQMYLPYMIWYLTTVKYFISRYYKNKVGISAINNMLCIFK